MSKMIIIEGNSNDKDNVRAYMVKGEKGDPGVSPTVEVSKEGKVTTIIITDVEGEHTITLNDGEDGTTANIINSTTLTDKTKETYSANILDTLLDDKLDANKIATITGSYTVLSSEAQHEESINFPTGFSLSNCVVISLMAKYTGQQSWLPADNWGINSQGQSAIQTFLGPYDGSDSNIHIIHNIDTTHSDFTVEYKLVLLKIS